MEKKFIVTRPFNHNVVLCKNRESKKECILIGKGIGFGLKENSYIEDEEKIEKIFYLIDESNKNKFKGLTEEVSNEVIGISEEVIAMISNEVKKELNENIHVTLADHISFALERLKSGINIINPFLVEIKTLYSYEYTIACKALEIINKKLKVMLPDDEIGFIAMHIHAASSNVNLSKTAMNTSIISEMVEFIEEKLGFNIDRNSIDYGRLVTHLRFALNRAEKKISLKNLLLGSIKRQFKDSYKLSKEMAKKIKQEYNVDICDDEIGYLALHIEKIKNK